MNSTGNVVTVEPNGYIRITVRGQQTYESVKAVENDVRTITNLIRQKNQPVVIVIELAASVKQGLPAREAGREFLNKLDYDKIAMYGARPFLRHVVNMIIAGSVHDNRVKNFATHQEALDWLHN